MVDSTTVQARLNVPLPVYVTLGERPDRVRECVSAAASEMERVASEAGRRLSETPRLVAQSDPHPLLDAVELTFEAETVPR
ncbi:MAG: hypothetical protein ACTHQ3_15850 [Motilibacteraceae bacterium]